MGLSKSKYTTYCQCPKALWLRTYDADKATPIDEAAMARFAAGNEVGDLAMGLFGDFVEVTTTKEDGSLDLVAMIEKTKQCLVDGTENIAEASFAWEGNYCAVDILHKTEEGWAIYEVKSSTGSDDPKKNTRAVLQKYAYDIAYQKFVLEKCEINVTGVYLVRLNSDYVRGDELDLQRLFHVTDMSELVAEESLVIEQKVAAAQNMLKQSTPPCIDLGKQCKKPYQCAFFEYCRGELPENSVFELYRLPFAKKLELFKAGKVTISQLEPEDARTMIQQIQLATYLFGEPESIDNESIRKFLDEKIHYPLYFLDFETSQYAIPQFKASRPYQQIPFQYSLHYIEQPGGELKHTEFLGDGVTDPRRAMAEQLVRDIPLGACTTAYNKSFECGRIEELANLYSDLHVHLMDIRNHIVDFLDPFRQGYFYKESMHGSFSIKKVLPALFPNDPELDYHNLQGGVQNGGDAMNIYPKMAGMTPEEREKTRKALLNYCGLDTYAMVKVWEKLVEVSKTR